MFAASKSTLRFSKRVALHAALMPCMQLRCLLLPPYLPTTQPHCDHAWRKAQETPPHTHQTARGCAGRRAPCGRGAARQVPPLRHRRRRRQQQQRRAWSASWPVLLLLCAAYAAYAACVVQCAVSIAVAAYARDIRARHSTAAAASSFTSIDRCTKTRLALAGRRGVHGLHVLVAVAVAGSVIFAVPAVVPTRVVWWEKRLKVLKLICSCCFEKRGQHSPNPPLSAHNTPTPGSLRGLGILVALLEARAAATGRQGRHGRRRQKTLPLRRAEAPMRARCVLCALSSRKEEAPCCLVVACAYVNVLTLSY